MPFLPLLTALLSKAYKIYRGVRLQRGVLIRLLLSQIMNTYNYRPPSLKVVTQPKKVKEDTYISPGPPSIEFFGILRMFSTMTSWRLLQVK